MNFALGKHYGIEYREKNPEEFAKRFKNYVEAYGDCLYGIVCDENSNFHCLFSTQKNYIMTESGATYANVSLR